MAPFNFRGMMAPTIAPMNKDGSLNLGQIKDYALRLSSNKVKGVFVNGTSGEGMSLTLQERKEVAEAWARHKDLIPTIIIQVGGGCLKDTQELAAHAEKLGVSGIASLPNLYDKPRDLTDLVDYCAMVANAAPKTPFFYYHIPMKTGVQMPMSEFLSMAGKAIPTLAGMKFTDEDVTGEGKKCLSVCGGNMKIFCGFDQTLFDALSAGFDSAINASFNFMAERSIQIFEAIEENKEEAKNHQELITNTMETIIKQTDGFTVGAVKAAMTLMTGLDVGPPRLPNRGLSEAQTRDLRQQLEDMGHKLD
ncbi:N-acetylneuraminate lyase-like [Oratosquilla oratoria]|uniref:N-acetylneuraminate lyase-like n=1 Tax=Oratosquilla oratoria TaxID=337810 RepID=UPI003F77534B